MKVGTLATMVATLLIGFPIASMAGVAPDTDNDTVPDVIDNCTEIPNAGAASCDTDTDGYGNACDGDYNQDLIVGASDIQDFMAPDFLASTDSGVGTDHNCDGLVGAADIQDFLAPQFLQSTPGPSGLSCAGTVPCL